MWGNQYDKFHDRKYSSASNPFQTCDLSDLRSDADGYRSALLGGISFLGRELDEAGTRSNFGKVMARKTSPNSVGF